MANRSVTPKTRLLFITIAAIVLMQLTACNINVLVGNKPDVTVLETRLKSGASTEQDVQNALGKPAGKGREMLPFMNAPRDMWTYYYEEGDLNDDRRLFLFVFFDNGHYDGYMWFSSLQEKIAH